MLRGLYTLVKEITKLFWMSTAVVVLIKLFFMPEMNAVLALRAGLLAALVFVFLELLLYLLITFIRRREDRKIALILRDEGVTPGLLNLIVKRIKRAKGPIRRASEQLTLASFLSEGGYYDRCFETLREIDFGALSESCREEYFNIYVYSNLMAGDTAAAERICETAMPYFERAQIRSYPMPVLHTMGVLWYTKQDYPAAEEYFSRALAAARSSFSKCECQIYLSLCYLNTGRLGHAVYFAKAARENITTIYQRMALENVRERIEQVVGA